MTDFIIVGRGLAANVIAHTFHKYNLSFTVIGSSALSNCSQIAAGIFNPVVFKRFTKSWLAHKTIPFLNSFFNDCEKLTGGKFITPRNLIKVFADEQEKKLWIKKAKNELADFLDETIYSSNVRHLNGCLPVKDYGIVKQAGNVNVAEFIQRTENYFKNNFITEDFNFNELNFYKDKITYRDYTAKNIIFCEGYLVKNNPLFNWVPLNPVKGEIVKLISDELDLNNSILNKNGFILKQNNSFICGATYNWDELNEQPSEKGKNELESKLKAMVSCPYSLIEQSAGVRPASVDRRPIIGAHPQKNNAFIFNGLGTKGVMQAPYFANNFVNFYLQKEALNSEININRFYSHYKK